MFSVHVNRPSWHWSPPNALVSYGFVNWHASDLDIAQLLSHFPTTHSHVLHLDIGAGFGRLMDMGDVNWLRLLHQFSTARTLRLGCGPAEHVALALEDMISGGLVDEVLPSLDLIYIEAQPASTIEKFIAARELSGCPVIVVDTETEFDERLESYVSK
ncbi:hypothetical protein EDB86DRAFT_757322 [Lactarius hatsudake]|nr:hypothetical protein EDB86DRAFT_757322 [Lactarius hatsudake]